jgi:hypothetical protein
MMLLQRGSAVWLARLSGTDSGTVQPVLDVQEGKHMIRNRGHYWQVKVYAGRDP